MTKKQKSLTPCPACEGQGRVCCLTWAACRIDGLAAQDLKFSGVGFPFWPLREEWEMNFCPFCGRRFKPRSS
jgi:hypothetical protein